MWLNYFTLALSIVFNLYLICYYIATNRTKSVLICLAFVIQCSSLIYVQISLSRRRHVLIATIFEATRLITKLGKRRFQQTCRVLFVAYVFVQIAELLFLCFNRDDIELINRNHTSPNGGVRNVLNICVSKLVIALESVYFNGLFVFTLMLYAALFMLVHGLCRVINTATVVRLRTWKTIRTSEGISELRELRYKVYVLIQALEECLSILPFLWITLLFIETTSTLMATTEYGMNFSRILLFWSNLTLKFLVTAVVTIMVDKISTENRKNHGLLIENFLVGEEEHDLRALFKEKAFLYEVHRFQLANPSAAGFFEFNRETLLGFAAATISISVMLLSMFYPTT